MGSVDGWNILDDLIGRDDGEKKEPDKFNEAITRRPATATATSNSRKMSTDDWLGLRPNVIGTADNNAIPSSSYEPSSSRGGLNTSRRQNFRRQSTQQHGASRLAGLLFSEDDDDDNDDSKNVAGDVDKRKVGGRNAFDDLFADESGTNRISNSGRSAVSPTVTMTAAIGETTPNVTSTVGFGITTTADSTLSKRRETSPSIKTVTNTTATEKMPSWLSGLIQSKDETLHPSTYSTADVSIVKPQETQAVANTEKIDRTEHKVVEENSPSSIVSLLKEKTNLQSAELELIHQLAKKKQDIQQASITLIQDQQNNDLLIKMLLMNNNYFVNNHDNQDLERLQSENHKFKLTIDHLNKKHELELDTLKTKYELQQNVLHEKLDRFEERINELEDERKIEINERKENEKRLKEMYEERLRVIHESHLIDLKQSTEVQKIKMNHLEEVESSLRDLKPKRLTSDEMTAREISISAQDKQLKDLQQELNKQLATLEGEKSALQMKIEEFQSRNQRERNELELTGKELKRSTKAFEDERKTWEREKKSEIQYIESRKQELENVRSSVVEEQRKLAEERYEVASERYKLESMLKLDTDTGSTGTNLIQAKVEVKENFKELRKKEKELEKRMELVKEMEIQLTKEKHKLQEQDDEIKMKSIRAEKMLKVNLNHIKTIAISKQEDGLKALENAKDIQNKFDKKGKDIQNRLFDIISREENIVREETKLAKEKEIFNKQRKKLNLVLPQLSSEEMHFLNPNLNKYEAEKEVHYKKSQFY